MDCSTTSARHVGWDVSQFSNMQVITRKTWEKAVYYLLLKYRTKHLENYNMDDEDEAPQRRRQPLQVEMSGPLLCGIRSERIEGPSKADLDKTPTHENDQIMTSRSPSQDEAITAMTSARPTAPTPQRAGGKGRETDSTPPSPHHVCAIPSPTACRDPSLEKDADVFTATVPHVPTTSSTPDRPLQLPKLPEPSALDPPILPMINLQEATPMRLEQVPIQYDLSSNASSSPKLSPILSIPGIVIPNLDNVDETVQRFFKQIVDHLNTMQMWQSTASASTHSNSATPEPSIKDTPGMTLTPRLDPRDARIVKDKVTAKLPYTPSTSSNAELDPDEIRFQDATEESTVSPDLTIDSEVLGLGISDYRQGTRKNPLTTRPLFQQQQQQQVRSPPPGRAHFKPGYRAAKDITTDKRSHLNSEDKENIGVQKDTVKREGVQLYKKSSLRSAEDKKKTLSDKHVQILLPSQESQKPKSRPRTATQSGGSQSPPIRRNDTHAYCSRNLACSIGWFIFLTY